MPFYAKYSMDKANVLYIHIPNNNYLSKEQKIMDTFVQFCIGIIFSIYGVFSLFQNRKKQEKEKLVISLVCILIGIFLFGYAVLNAFFPF